MHGESEASTIRSNVDLMIAFRTNHWETLKELSYLCGTRYVIQDGSQREVPLITPDALAAMKSGQALIMLKGSLKFVSWLPVYYVCFNCLQSVAPVQREQKERRKVRIFSINNAIEFMKSSAFASLPAGDRTPFDSPLPDWAGPMDTLTDREIEKESHRKDVYGFVITTYEGDKMKLIKALMNKTYLRTPRLARMALDDLPLKLYFSTKKDMYAARGAVLDAGADIHNLKQYMVKLVDAGDNIEDVSRVLAVKCNYSEDEIRIALANLPVKIALNSFVAALDAQIKLDKVGAIAEFMDLPKKK